MIAFIVTSGEEGMGDDDLRLYMVSYFTQTLLSSLLLFLVVISCPSTV